MNTPIAVLLSRKGSTVYAVTPMDTVADAARVMNQHKIGSVAVMQGGRLAGMFTERDVLTRVVGAGRMPNTTCVADVMTHTPVTVSPDATVEEIMAVFTDRRCRHLPVLDSDGSVLGIISIGDVTRWQVDMHRSEAEYLRQYISGSYVT